MVWGDGNDQERKTSRCLDSRGGGDRIPVSQLLELDGLRVSKGGCVQLDSAAGAGEICGGCLLRESFAVSQKSGPFAWRGKKGKKGKKGKERSQVGCATGKKKRTGLKTGHYREGSRQGSPSRLRTSRRYGEKSGPPQKAAPTGTCGQAQFAFEVSSGSQYLVF